VKIARVQGREILDSRGNPTVEVDVTLESGAFGRAAVPSGASTGEREALELRDGDKKRYLGKGVLKAVANINGELAKARDRRRAGSAVARQKMIELDGTPTKSRLGANALLGVSMAAAHAAAPKPRSPVRAPRRGGGERLLPVPMMNILNGGAHADSNVDVQEFMVMPVGAPTFRRGSANRRRDLPLAAVVSEEARPCDRCRRRGRVRAQPEVEPRSAGARAGSRRECGIQGRRRRLSRARRRVERVLGQRPLCVQEVRREDAQHRRDGRHAREWARDYPIISIEDGVAENDWTGWKLLTKELGEKVQLVGDDLFVTNPAILKRGIEENVANALLVKVNQIGTMTETLEAMAMARAPVTATSCLTVPERPKT
jgi:enolase